MAKTVEHGMENLVSLGWVTCMIANIVVLDSLSLCKYGIGLGTSTRPKIKLLTIQASRLCRIHKGIQALCCHV